MRGKFEPFKLSDDARKKMRRAGNIGIYKQTRGPLRDIYKELRGTKLTRDEEPAPRPTVRPTAPSSLPQLPPGLTVTPQNNAPSRVPPGLFVQPNRQVDPRLIPNPQTRDLLNR